MTRCAGRFSWQGLSVLGVLLLAVTAGRSDEPEAARAVSTVGMPAKLDGVILPGSELEARPIEDRRAPLVLRVAASYPHGTDRRYDLIFYGLEPGRYDLTTYLRRKDGSAAGSLPPIVVQVDPLLPPGQVEPHALALSPAPWLGGYRLLLALFGSLWCAGLVAILLGGRRRRAELARAEARPLTLADRLAPLVAAARDGSLGTGQQAELERLLIGYWRKRLGLEQASPARSMAAMKEHPEAGPLFRRLEEWLHRPGPRAEAADLAALLEPYRALPADEEEPGPTPAALPTSPLAPAGGHAR